MNAKTATKQMTQAQTDAYNTLTAAATALIDAVTKENDGRYKKGAITLEDATIMCGMFDNIDGVVYAYRDARDACVGLGMRVRL